MIIELSADFSEFSASDWAPYHGAIENLIVAHGQGWHLFSPARGAASSILNGCALSLTQRQIFEHRVFSRMAVLSGQAKAAHLTILANVNGREGHTSRNNQVGVPLQIFSDPRNCAPSKLITENASTDGRVLELLANLMARELGYGSPLQFELVHGGGGTTATCYGAACGSGQPALCVVDSDRKYPGAPLGETARQVELLNGSEISPATRFFTLPVRELENALPLSVWLDVYSANAEVRARVERLLRYAKRRVIERVQDERNVLDYFDFKSGLKRGDVAKIPDAARPAFVRFAQIVSHHDRTKGDYTDKSDTTLIHPGVADAALSQFVSYLEGPVPLGRKVVAQKIQKSPLWNWLEGLLKLVLAYGVAGQKLPFR